MANNDDTGTENDAVVSSGTGFDTVDSGDVDGGAGTVGAILAGDTRDCGPVFAGGTTSRFGGAALCRLVPEPTGQGSQLSDPVPRRWAALTNLSCDNGG